MRDNNSLGRLVMVSGRKPTRIFRAQKGVEHSMVVSPAKKNRVGRRAQANIRSITITHESGSQLFLKPHCRQH